MRFPKKISEGDRIPLFQKIMFSLGQNTDYLATGLTTGVMWLPFFNIGMGIHPAALGIILVVLRAWDAISDPFVGNLSDNVRTRWGRRRPFIFVAAITTAALYPLLWHFPQSVLDGTSWLAGTIDWIPYIETLKMSASDKAVSVYLILVGLVFFTSFTCWSMPYYALQLELTPNYDERTRLTAVMTVVSKLSAFITGWTFVVVVFAGTIAQGDLSALEGKPQWIADIVAGIQPFLHGIAGEHVDEKPIVTGMRLMSWVFLAMIIVLGILPALFVKERYYHAESSHRPAESFWKSIKESLGCGPLWSLIGASFFIVMGIASQGALSQYVNIYYVCNGDMIQAGTVAGVKATILTITGICLIPFYTWLGERYDKRTVVIMLILTSIFGHLLNYFLMTPEAPYLQIISGFFESSAIGAVWMFLPSMKADVADWDEEHTLRRREGSINAFYSWFIKASLTASMGLGGVVLAMTGFDVDLPAQSKDVLMRMFQVFVVLPVGIWFLALLSVWFYPLTRQKCEQLRRDLESRRGEI